MAMTDGRFDDKPIAMLRRVGREALATRMIDLFVASAPERAAAIRAAHADGDLAMAGRSAHSLKPSAGQLGAVRLQAVCQQIEDAAGNADAVAVGALLPQLDSELSAAMDWLRSGASNPHPAPARE
jgi:HPt (histidine-containing phosphotransfer) domain-containing protein